MMTDTKTKTDEEILKAVRDIEKLHEEIEKLLMKVAVLDTDIHAKEQEIYDLKRGTGL